MSPNWKNIDRLRVELRFGAEKIVPVGTLVADGKTIYTVLEVSFLDSGLDISPFKLKRTVKPQQAGTAIFGGLFGVFDDSLPDGWGRLLIDRRLQELNIPPSQIGPLDRLAMVGDKGIGALTYQPVREVEADITQLPALDTLATEAFRIHQDQESELLGALTRLGGSSGGARPKVLLGYNPTTATFLPDAPILPDGYDHWIIKFASSQDRKDSARMEYAYHLMAVAAGIRMSECKLFKGKSGEVYFGTKRFDRDGGKRKHLHSLAGLVHDNFRLPSLDYGHAMDAAFRLTRNVRAQREVLRLACFNVLAHNRDDHSKNLSFIMDEGGEWAVAPAYDLTYSNTFHGEQSLTVAGKGKEPGIEDLVRLAGEFEINEIGDIIEEVRSALRRWPEWAEQAGLPRKKAPFE